MAAVKFDPDWLTKNIDDACIAVCMTERSWYFSGGKRLEKRLVPRLRARMRAQFKRATGEDL